MPVLVHELLYFYGRMKDLSAYFRHLQLYTMSSKRVSATSSKNTQSAGLRMNDYNAVTFQSLKTIRGNAFV